jgi:hypothetical protein
MEMLRSFLCPNCDELCKVNNGDYLFSYNIECLYGHKQTNLEQEFLLMKRKVKQNIFKCKNHRKKNQIHCYTCNEDICILCFKDMHQNHKYEYLKNLKLGTREEYNNNYNLNKQKEILQIFLTELNAFQAKFDLYIDILKEKLKKQNEFKFELFKNISENNFSFIDIENFNINSKNDIYKKMEDFMEKFINQNTFLEKYEYLKNILDELIKKGKYIEEKKVVNRINNYIDLNLMPLNNDNLFVQCKKNYISNNSEITIFQEIIDKDRENYDYIPIISKNFPFIINKCPILLENVPKIDNETSFYCISDNSVIKLMIKKQLEIGEDPKFDCIINIFNTLATTALTVLTKDKNIVFKSNQNIILFDDNFSIENAKELNQKLPGEFSTVENVLTIDKNSFIFTIKNFNSTEPNIYLIKVDEDSLYKINTNDLTPLPLFYMKQKKILISFCYEYKYNNIKDNNNFYITLINFNVEKPEIVQMININYYDISKKVFYFNCFNDDSFYFPICKQTYNKEMFYKVIYISQYKLIKGEFREVSRIKKEDDFSLKKFNYYGNK